MPIVIDEIVISIDVGNAAAGGASNPPPPSEDRQALVAECAERVLEILRERQEP